MPRKMFALDVERAGTKFQMPKQSIIYPRITVRVTKEMEEALDEIKTATRASSHSEILRRSLIVYHTIVMQKLAGNDAYIEINENGASRRVPIFM